MYNLSRVTLGLFNIKITSRVYIKRIVTKNYTGKTILCLCQIAT